MSQITSNASGRSRFVGKPPNLSPDADAQKQDADSRQLLRADHF
jgi:hypothetical protein